ncbi:MAG: hypothetical protein ACLUOI_36805 [Eisenbergiella sp.]
MQIIRTAGISCIKKIEATIADNDDSYSVFLPMYYPNGSVYWVKLVGFFTDEYIDGRQVTYATMVNVTDMLRDTKGTHHCL